MMSLNLKELSIEIGLYSLLSFMSITIAGNLKSTAEIQYNGIYNRWCHFDDFKFQSHLNFERLELLSSRSVKRRPTVFFHSSR